MQPAILSPSEPLRVPVDVGWLLGQVEGSSTARTRVAPAPARSERCLWTHPNMERVELQVSRVETAQQSTKARGASPASGCSGGGGCQQRAERQNDTTCAHSGPVVVAGEGATRRVDRGVRIRGAHGAGAHRPGECRSSSCRHRGRRSRPWWSAGLGRPADAWSSPRGGRGTTTLCSWSGNTSGSTADGSGWSSTRRSRAKVLPGLKVPMHSTTRQRQTPCIGVINTARGCVGSAERCRRGALEETRPTPHIIAFQV